VFNSYTPEEPAPTEWTRPVGSRIAVIYATGSIVTGSGAGGSILGSATMARLLRRAREDAAVRAVVLRIDSGGGSGLASEIIAREVELTREAGKPVVVSMGATAASGGYFIAAAADRIVAQPVTLTGSIGVTALSVHVPELLEQLRLAFAQVSTAQSADFLSSFEAPKEEDVEQLEESIRWQYDRFVSAVAEGRDMSEEAVREVAQGRIWSGRQALELGLVDELGGFTDALRSAKQAAGIVGPVQIVPFTEMIAPRELLEAAQRQSVATRTSQLQATLEEALATVEAHRRMVEDGLLYYEPLRILPAR
jgi:protease-4